jgi:hypothetical protein
VVEEMSTLDANLWGHLCKLCLRGQTQFLVIGDFEQLQPVSSTWCGKPIHADALEDSDMLYEMTGGCRCFLDRNMRSDSVIFDFVKSLRRSVGRSLEDALAEARERFPYTDGVPDTTLCISHATRMKVNESLNELKRPEGAIRVPLPAHGRRFECPPQAFWSWPGQVLVSESKKRPLEMSAFYVVVAVDDRQMVLRSRTDGTVVNLSTGSAALAMRLADCLTYAKAQGLTIEGHVRLLDCDHAFFTRRHLYMGVSRVTASELVSVK